jgi:lipid-binding SYLF domain-containing protein
LLSQVIQNAKGIAIFTTMRTGLWLSGSGGAGVLVARLPDGSWSPPSGLMLHTVGLGFLAGIDIYDCVMVINTTEALEGFSKMRGTVGGEMSAVAGPVGMGAVLESEVHKRRAPIFTYLKSRGLYAGIQMDGTVLIERTDENERFYGEKLTVMEIFQGRVRHPPESIQTLMLTLRAAQGEDVDWSVLPSEPPPSDFEIDHDQVFGVPDKMDPDPYGVLALEKEGLQLKEAGTHKRASHEAFVFNPSPSSPVFQTFNRNSLDGRSMSRRSSWRTSVATTVAAKTDDNKDKSRPPSTMVDMAVQTDFDNDTPLTSPTRSNSNSISNKKMADIAEDSAAADTPAATSTPTAGAGEKLTNGVHHTPESRSEDSVATGKKDRHDSTDGAADVSSDEEEPVVVQTVQTAATPQFINRARLVSVKKPNAPALPPRNPVRAHGKGLSIGSINSPPPLPERTSQDEEVEVEKRPEVERTRSHDETTLVDLGEKREGSDEVKEKESAKDKDVDEFHSAANSPKMVAVDLNDDVKPVPVAVKAEQI